MSIFAANQRKRIKTDDDCKSQLQFASTALYIYCKFLGRSILQQIKRKYDELNGNKKKTQYCVYQKMIFYSNILFLRESSLSFDFR